MPAVVEVLPSSSDEDEHPVAPAAAPAEAPGNGAATKKLCDGDGKDEAAAPSANERADEHGGRTDPNASAGGEKVTEDTPLVAVDIAECTRLKLQGNSFFGQGRVDEALAQYRKAILKAPIKPIRKPKRSAAAAAAADMIDDEAATAEGDEAADGTRTSTGHCEDAGGKQDAAEKEEEDAPDTTDYTLTSQVFCNAGYCLMKLELFDEAAEMLSEAIRHDEAYQKAYLRRADCYYHLEKWSSAYGDYESYAKLGGVLDHSARARRDAAKKKTDEEMQKMLGDLKELGNRFLGNFGLSTDMFKFDKDPKTGGYSMRFERN